MVISHFFSTEGKSSWKWPNEVFAQMLLIRWLQKVSGELNYYNYAMLDFRLMLMGDETASSICQIPRHFRHFISTIKDNGAIMLPVFPFTFDEAGYFQNLLTCDFLRNLRFNVSDLMSVWIIVLISKLKSKADLFFFSRQVNKAGLFC